MSVVTAFSKNTDSKTAAHEICEKFGTIAPTLILFFASSEFDHQALAHEMKQCFADVPILGCSTAGEIITGKMLKKSCVAMAFDHEVIEKCTVRIVPNISSENHIPDVFKQFEDALGIQMQNADITAYVGVILIDGLRGAEERLMEKIGDLTNLAFIGGSAGDDAKFEQTWVYADGKAYTDAAVIALIKPTKGFDVLKTQSFCTLNTSLTATKVDEIKRKVIEFNGKPATQAYAQAVGVRAEAAKDKFMSNPVGLMVGDEPYIRSPQRTEDTSIVFYCAVKEGMELNLLESTNIVEDTRAALANKKEQMGNPVALINFNCILRTLELDQTGQSDAYGAVFSDIPTIGFSTYGEEYIGHINQTATMLIFK